MSLHLPADVLDKYTMTYDLKLVTPEFDSKLTTSIIELDHLLKCKERARKRKRKRSNLDLTH